MMLADIKSERGDLRNRIPNPCSLYPGWGTGIPGVPFGHLGCRVQVLMPLAPCDHSQALYSPDTTLYVG